MINKILVILLALFLFLIPFGLLLRFQIAPNVSIVPQDFIAAVLFIFVAVIYVKRKMNPFKSDVSRYFVLFVVFGFLSLIVNSYQYTPPELLVASLYPIRLIIYSALFIAAFFLTKRKQFLVYVFLISVTLTNLIGFLQFFYYSNLKNLSYLGWDDHFARLFSSFLDPNFAGAYYVITFLILIGLGYSMKGKIQIYSFALALFCLLSLYLTYSRSAQVMLLASLFTLALLVKKVKYFVLVAIILIGVYFAFANRGLENTDPFRTVSAEARIFSAQDAITIASKSPLIGIGFNAYRYAQVNFGIATSEGAATSNAAAGTDNSYLFILATTGIVGLAFYLLFYFSMLKKLFRQNTFIAKIFFAVVVGILVDSMFINTLFYTPILSILFVAMGLFAFKADTSL